MDEQQAWLILARAPSLHAGILQPLLQRFGSAAALLALSTSELQAADTSRSLSDYLARANPDAIEPERLWLEHEQHHFLHWADPRYPPLLRQVKDAPIALFVRGDANCLNRAQLAIVGSRNPTRPGCDTAAAFAQQFAQQGLIVTSGLALGIDAAAHRGALTAAGQTIAVCGTGLDHVYPRSHRVLAEEIAANGAVVSEFPLGTQAIKSNFPRRNRVISGLTLGTLVIEAALRSGSLITARLAAEHGREVFAVPGSIHNPLAQGCHQLIRQGASLVERADDVLRELGPLAAALTRPREMPASSTSTTPDRPLDKEYEILLDALGFEPAGVDRLVDRTGLNSGAVASMLLMLELDGHVESHPGGAYVRTRPEEPK